MTKEEFFRVCGFIQVEIIDRSQVRNDWEVKDVIIDNCGGHELHMFPKSIMWENELSLLLAWCQTHCLTVESRFSEGKIVIR